METEVPTSPSREFELNDPRTHFIVTYMGEVTPGLKKAYLTWHSDSQDYYPKVHELDFKQLNVEIVRIFDGSLGHGWLYYRGNLRD